MHANQDISFKFGSFSVPEATSNLYQKMQLFRITTISNTDLVEQEMKMTLSVMKKPCHSFSQLLFILL